MIVPDQSVRVIRLLASPLPVKIGVESDVANGAEESHPIELTVGATGRVASIVRVNGVVGLTFPELSVLIIV
jgi:hypothetical protein